jgi:lysozyme
VIAQNKNNRVTQKPSAKKKTPVKRKKAKGLSNRIKIVIAFLLLILLSPFYYGYVLKAFTSAWRRILDIGENPNYRTYKSFNIRIPQKYSIHGIDVSYAQGKIDWQKVKTMEEDSVQIAFAFIKATEGLATVDPYFQRNWREGPKAGIICGAYHYFRAEKNGKWQARFFLQNVKMEKGDMPPVVDIEKLYGTTPEKMRAELTDFLIYVKSKTHSQPIIYSGLSFYQDYLAGYFDNYKLWIANYNHAELNMIPDANWVFWQHSEQAHVNGINHVVDFDAFKNDSLSFRKLLMP